MVIKETLRNWVTTGLALVIAVPATVMIAAVCGVMIPVVVISEAVLNRKEHRLTVLEDFGGECAMECSCGEKFYSSSHTGENVRWNEGDYMSPKCPRES